MRQFKDRTALITGAASGIGKALAIALASEGCHLCLVDIHADGLMQLTRELRSANVRVREFVCDLTNTAALDLMARHAVQASGGIDLLINNAGIAWYGPTDSMTHAQWDRLMSINLLAPIRLTQQLLPELLRRPDPHIVNMCSVSGLVAGGRFTAYHTSKFGLVGFTEALRAEYRRKGVGVTAICPGPVLTNLYASAAGARSDRAVPTPPRWMCATPERVAKVTLRAIRRNRRQVLITPTAHVLFQLKRFAPWLIDFMNGFSRNGRRKRLAAIAAEQNSPTTTASVSTGHSAAEPSGSQRRAA